MSASSTFRIEGSWRAWRGVFAALGLVSAWALAQTQIPATAAFLAWLVATAVGLWTARWSLLAHRITADGADGMGLVWAGHDPLVIEQLSGYGPVWVLRTARSTGSRRCAVLAALWSSAQRREFRRRWALRRTDPMRHDSIRRDSIRRDSAPSV